MVNQCPECDNTNLEYTCIGTIIGEDTNKASCTDRGWSGKAQEVV